MIDNGPVGAIATRRRLHHPRGYVQTVLGVGRLAHCHDDHGTPLSLYEPSKS
jgi:hypothetical protein